MAEGERTTMGDAAPPGGTAVRRLVLRHGGAEERQREARLRDGVIRVEALARERKFDEALRLLGRLASDNPNSPDLASCRENIRRRAWGDCWPRTEQGRTRRAGSLALPTLGSKVLESRRRSVQHPSVEDQALATCG